MLSEHGASLLHRFPLRLKQLTHLVLHVVSFLQDKSVVVFKLTKFQSAFLGLLLYDVGLLSILVHRSFDGREFLNCIEKFGGLVIHNLPLQSWQGFLILHLLEFSFDFVALVVSFNKFFLFILNFFLLKIQESLNLIIFNFFVDNRSNFLFMFKALKCHKLVKFFKFQFLIFDNSCLVLDH